MKVLVINAGSSSLKYQLIDMDTKSVLAKGLCERIGIDGSNLQHTCVMKGLDKKKIEKPMKDHGDAIQMVIDALVDPEIGVIKSMDEIGAVGHRVVHGAEEFTESTIITEAVMKTLDKCTPLAPLHNPPNIIGINACTKIMPNTPQVAVFDTAFHQTMPAHAFMYALPYECYENDRIRKYGFHGTSHKYVSQEAIKLLGKDAKDLKIVTCHLGNGSSISAVDGGKCIDTSMGFTPLDGVPMGTRTGSMDPAVMTFLMNKGMSAKEIDNLVNKQSGVAGVSGVSSDFRDLSAAAEGAFTRYEQLAHEGSTDENSVNYNFGLCMIKRDHKSGKDYLPLFDGADLGEYESMLRALDVASVRYILLDGDHVTHVEADLSGSDATQLLAMAKEELSGIDAEMSLSSLKIHFDISGWNAVRLNLMQDVIGDKVIY